ncbi:MAG: tetratricopeptide repeat protein [Limisphaerales bacterium]
MPNGVRIDARRDFVRLVLPWLIAAGMLLFYLLTLNHWVSLGNLGAVARLSGWTWTPQFESPLFFLVTMPLRLLPVPLVPLAMNFFSAVCAALALGLLARSVGLLPHDRTEAQQVRERNDFFVLTIPSAWLPPLLASLLCGLQLSFWLNATNGGSPMFDLLLFAFVVWSLVEYRLDGRVWRLYASAAVVGAGVVEGLAMTAFFPLFVVAVIWVRRLAFFNARFLIRIFLYGLGGFLLLLLYQVAPALRSHSTVTFANALKFSLGMQSQIVRLFWDCATNPGAYLGDLLMPIFISLMPLLVLSVRWKFGDNSKIGSSLASVMFHAIHAIFLAVCLWIAFDPPFSPRQKELGLTLYYLIALSAGYYAGYFLLIFGKRHLRAREAPSLWASLGNKAVVTAVWVIAALAVAGLVCKNARLVRSENGNTLRAFSSLVMKKLPRKGAIVLSDDAERMYLTKAALASKRRGGKYLFIDTAWLPYPQYHRFLNKESPQQWPLLVKPDQTNALNPMGLIELLALLSRTNEIYYLHPSFGYYFEAFYAEPHGLVYRLKPLPGNTLLPPKPDTNLVAENQTFWKKARANELAAVGAALDPGGPKSFVDAQLDRLRVPHEVDINAATVGCYCSRSLDFWGVELQRMGDLTDAAAKFREALEFNTNNSSAQVNIAVNEDLSAGRKLSADPFSSIAIQRFGEFNNLMEILNEDGPIDDPAFCFRYGVTLAQMNRFYRQAVAPLKRACQLDPNYWPARFLLARVYGMDHLPNQMFEALRAPIHPQNGFSDADSRQLNMLLSAAYFQKNDLADGSRLLEREVSQNPTNQALLTTVRQIYMNRGMFSNALSIAQMQLRFSANDPSFLTTKGYLCNQLQRYDEAIATLKRALAIRKQNTEALFQLASAYFRDGNLEGARTNLEKLQRAHWDPPRVAFGLEEIAWRQHDTNEAIRNIEIYLPHAPTNSPPARAEAQLLEERLRQLKQ